MARILRLHPALTRHQYHILTDLDFWDARRILKDIAEVRRNFGKHTSGDEFPTQVVADYASRQTLHQIEKRIGRAIASPPRHLIVRSMIVDGFFDFDPLWYYPKHWSRSLMTHFTYHRLPLEQAALCTPFQTVRLSWVGDRISVERVPREMKTERIVKSREDARRHIAVPSCF